MLIYDPCYSNQQSCRLIIFIMLNIIAKWWFVHIGIHIHTCIGKHTFSDLWNACRVLGIVCSVLLMVGLR